MESVAILGVGLIGGSFALALRAAGYTGEILGVSSPSTIERARALGAVDRACTLEEAARHADLLFLAQPVGVIRDSLAAIASHLRPHTLVTDAGSTKAVIVAEAQRHPAMQFLGGHPLAGKEIRGVEAAEAALFQGRTWVLTPVKEDSLHRPAVVEFRAWLERIGAQVVALDAETHDRALAFSSHLPQLAAVALASGCGASGLAEQIAAARLFGPALQEATRLARSPFSIWRDILATNNAPVHHALECYIMKLQQLKEELERGESSGLDREFQAAALFAASIRPSGQLNEERDSSRRSVYLGDEFSRK